ncbi:MAG: hypothetical protein MH825_09835 [Cyanobacteria bacterium]|nr:hypothetical protein [Cyanobacteriota bacterium]
MVPNSVTGLWLEFVTQDLPQELTQDPIQKMDPRPGSENGSRMPQRRSRDRGPHALNWTFQPSSHRVPYC